MHHFISFICFLSCHLIINAEVDQTGWIDPHDMTPVFDNEYFAYPDKEKEALIRTHDTNNCEQAESQARAYFKRTINMILNAVYEDAFDDTMYKGHLIFQISAKQYAKLHEFTSDRLEDLKEVDGILSEILKKPLHAYLKEHFLSWTHKVFRAITSRVGIVTLCVLAYLFVVYKLMVGNFNFYYILKFLLINLLIFDFVFIWIRLYQKVEIDKIADTVKYQDAPAYCNPKSMTLMQIIWNALSSTDCKKYYHVTLTDIFWSVSPGDVLVEMITRTITHPMKEIGPAIGVFVCGIYDAMPWGIRTILLPVILIFVMIMTCIILSFILNIPIKFNFFHLISFSFGDNAQRVNGNILTGRTVEQLLDIVKDNNAPRSIDNSRPTNISNTTNSVLKERTIGEESVALEGRKEEQVKTDLLKRENNNGRMIIEKEVEQEKKSDDVKQLDDKEYKSKEHFEKDVHITDDKKVGYEPDVIAETMDDKVEKKRKREDGAGDM